MEQLDINLSVRDTTEDFSLLRRALVRGLFQNTARRQPDGKFRMYSTGQVWLWICRKMIA